LHRLSEHRHCDAGRSKAAARASSTITGKSSENPL